MSRTNLMPNNKLKGTFHTITMPFVTLPYGGCTLLAAYHNIALQVARVSGATVVLHSRTRMRFVRAL